MIEQIWQRVDAIRESIENLSGAEVEAELAENADVLVVDIREIQERVDRGAIPGSVHVPRGMLEFWADPSLDYFRSFFEPQRRTVLYCAGGGRSALAVRTLEEMGYENVAHLAEGFDGWVAAGRPVSDVSANSKWVRRS